MRGNKYANMGRRQPRGFGPTNTHGEYYDSLPRSRPRTRAEQMEIDLSLAHKAIKQLKVSLSSPRELLRWLLDTYDFEAATVKRIRSVLP